MSVLLRVMCGLVGLQALSALAFASVVLSATNAQRVQIDRVSEALGGPSILAISLVAGVLGLTMLSFVALLVSRRRLGRWLVVGIEATFLLCGIVYVPSAGTTGLDPV